METYRGGHRLVLAGHGSSQDGPYLKINDLDAKKQISYPVLGKTFTARRLERRYCIGRFDLQTFESALCPLGVELLPTEKDDTCPACREATGFNPSFYFAEVVSPQQRAYNQTPHFVYLAYFSPRHVKAGISSETRGIERLLEQGARAARIVGRFQNADDARVLEAALCAQQGILETMRASAKARLLTEERYDVPTAKATLDSAAERMGRIPRVIDAGFAPEEVRDLSPYYFNGPSPDVSELQIPEGHEDECAGVCSGMVGGVLLMRQGSFSYATEIKEWASHQIELVEGAVAFEYDSAPQQISLF